MTTVCSHVPLGVLQVSDMNVRKTGRGAEPQFAASIRAKGIIEPLIVRLVDGTYTITNGSKRFDALIWLRDHKDTAAGVAVTDDFPVQIALRDESDNEARETSLVTNIIRAETHPVDVYEQLAAMKKGGMNETEIAARLAWHPRAVRQSLALAALSPTIRASWRTNEIGAKVAQTFTLASHAEQDRIFTRLKKSDDLNDWSVKRALKIGDDEGGRLLSVVGLDVYRKAGGKVVEDLFGTDHKVDDKKLLREMVNAKIEVICLKLVADGWSWAIPAPQNAHEYGRVEPKMRPTPEESARVKELTRLIEQSDDEVDTEDTVLAWETELNTLTTSITDRGFTKEQRKTLGCFVSVDHHQGLTIIHGRTRPEEKRSMEAKARAAQKKKAMAKNGKADEPAMAAISSAMAFRLSEMVTTAATQAIALDSDLALSLAVTALICNSGEAVCLTHRGMVAKRADRMSDKEPPRFDKTFARIFKQSRIANLAALAELVGVSLDLTTWQVDKPVIHKSDAFDDGEAGPVVANAIDAKAMNKALRRAFNADDYFNGVPKSFCLAAITEAVNADEARKIAIKPKVDVAKFAIANVPKTGWLPPQMRTTHYDGPKAKAAKKVLTKKKARR